MYTHTWERGHLWTQQPTDFLGVSDERKSSKSIKVQKNTSSASVSAGLPYFFIVVGLVKT